MSSAAADIIVPIRIDVGGVTSLQTNPNPATCVHKVLGKIPFLMSDLCISSIATAQKILVPNLVNSCKEPYPFKQSWIIFFLGFDVHICSGALTPHEKHDKNCFPVAGHLYTKGK